MSAMEYTQTAEPLKTELWVNGQQEVNILILKAPGTSGVVGKVKTYCGKSKGVPLGCYQKV